MSEYQRQSKGSILAEDTLSIWCDIRSRSPQAFQMELRQEASEASVQASLGQREMVLV